MEHGDGIRFTVDGRPATLPDHGKGATVSARKFVETPDVKITTATAGGGMHLRPNPRPPLLVSLRCPNRPRRLPLRLQRRRPGGPR